MSKDAPANDNNSDDESRFPVTVLRSLVQETLQDYRKGDLFMSHDLPETTPILSGDPNQDVVVVAQPLLSSPRKKQADNQTPWQPYHRFMAAVLDKTYEWYSQQQKDQEKAVVAGKERKQIRKDLKRVLQSHGSTWKAMILASQTTSSEDDDDDNNDDDDDSSSGPNKLTPRQQRLKADFDEEKRELMESLPATFKERFGKIVFAKWQKSHLPALVMSLSLIHI